MSRFVRPLRVLSAFRGVTARVAPVAPRLASSRAGFRYYATGPESISSTNPGLAHAQALLDDGTRALEEGDLQRAKDLYKRSIEAAATSGGYFNLGVCEYQLGELSGAIEAWKESIKLEPSADAYTNLGSAYLMNKPSQPAEAIKALTAAMEIAPDDPEIQFNLAATLESTDALDTALTLYKKAHAGGVERAATNIRNVGAKLLAKRLKTEEAEKKA